MHLTVDQVFWMDRGFNSFTTLIVCGFHYTFSGEITDEDLDPTISNIVSRLELWEEDGAEIEMRMDLVQKVLYRDTHETTIILN